ncbi:3-(3-hydroxy-phenyl)propionate transporter MhpT [Rhizobium paknamense]|uniref:AAHS family 3-hydroxyphenylpropionic acid transporter n=1 Tax=Rhizobium paknamense TaxID=1206817 RepID=A0ABU0IHS4_9HYPH|nr:3-(3-hydroxy-phenyl)propionate transporter MhpT [Rhizobium paknamense]MDQ0457818.1 AAHS family 3-hydroxyphenylpropionic acid transporter [Rhizobium paknamense]
MTTSTDHRASGGKGLKLAVLAATIEGFDLQAAGVAAPKLIPAFALNPNQVGLFFSSATVGLIIGALLGGRVADAFGRRTGLVLSLLTFGIFSIATAFVSSFEQLLLFRLLTGVGLGGALPNLVNIAAESVTPERRGRAVAMMYAGVPVGGGIASIVAMMGFHGGDWQSIFVVGGILPMLVAPIVHWMLPPMRVEKTQAKSINAAFSSIFAPQTLMTTMALWISFFLALLVFYLLLNWLPQLLIGRGFLRDQASQIQIAFNVGGAIGSLIGGGMLDRARPAFSTSFAYAAGAIALLSLSLLPANFILMLLAGMLLGGAFLCFQGILYGVAPQCYAYEVRGTGVGLAVAAGRLGSIVGPLLAGFLVSQGKTPADVMLLLVPITLVAGLFTVLLLWRRSRQVQTA